MCPLCEQTFIPRLVLMKSSMLVVLAEELKRTSLQLDLCPAGSVDGSCETCTEQDVKVSQSRLVYSTSYSENHLQANFGSQAFKELEVEEPLKKLQEKTVSQNYEDGQSYLCSAGEHHVHNKDPVQEENEEKQKREEFGQRDQFIKYVKTDKQEIKDVHCSSNEAAKTIEKILAEPICCLNKCNRSQQQPEDNQVRDLKEKVEEETNRVKRKTCHDLLVPNPSTTNVHRLDNTEVVSPTLSQVRRQLQDILDQWINVNPSNILLPGPKSLLRKQNLWTKFKSVLKDSVISLATCAALFSIYIFVFLSLSLILSVYILVEVMRNRPSEPMPECLI